MAKKPAGERIDQVGGLIRLLLWPAVIAWFVFLFIQVMGSFAIPGAIIVVGLAVAGLAYLRAVRGSKRQAEDYAKARAEHPMVIPRQYLPRRVQLWTQASDPVYVCTREHIIALLGRFILILAATSALLWSDVKYGLKPYSLIAYALVLIWTSFRIVDWYVSYAVVTERMLMKVYGVTRDEMPQELISRVTSSRPMVSSISKVLTMLRITYDAFGRVNLETAGQVEWLSAFRFMPDVMYVTLTIWRAVERPVRVTEDDDEGDGA